MAYDKLLTADPGVWTITLAQGSATAPVAGILLVTAGAREGDAVLDDEGRVLVIKALTETEITFAWPYKATTRTIDLVIEERSINRAINTASSAAAIAALARLQNAASLAPNYPVLSHSNTPPAVPADGDRHLVDLMPTGVWAGKAKHLALYSAATAEWSFTPPEDGMSVVLAGTSARLQYNGVTWGLDALGTGGGQLAGPLDWAPAVDIVSSATVDLGATLSNLVNITGAAAIRSLGTALNGVSRTVSFGGALTLVCSPALLLPGGLDIVTANGDWAEFVSRGSGNWECVSYMRIDGTPLALGSGSILETQLADASVTVQKIGDAAVSNAKLADGAVTTAKLATSTVTTAKLSDQAVTGAKLADLAVTSAKLADQAVTTAKVTDQAVSNAKLAVMGSARLKGRISAGAGTPEDLSSQEVRSLLGLPTASISGRLARFADATGAIGSSQIGEDTGGNLYVPGVIRSIGAFKDWPLRPYNITTLPEGGKVEFAMGSGLIMLASLHNGHAAMYLAGGGAIALISQTGNSFVVGPPSAGYLGLAWWGPGSFYYLENRVGTTIGVSGTAIMCKENS